MLIWRPLPDLVATASAMLEYIPPRHLPSTSAYFSIGNAIPQSRVAYSTAATLPVGSDRVDGSLRT